VPSPYFFIDMFVIAAGLLLNSGETGTNKYILLVQSLSPFLLMLMVAHRSSKRTLIVIAIQRCAEPLLLPIFLLSMLVTFSGYLVYWIEASFPDCNVDFRGAGGSSQYPAFLSIPQAMWFVIVTMSTVGYGDVYPKSDAGKAVAVFVILAGIGYMAMPLAIIGGQFTGVWDNMPRATCMFSRVRTTSEVTATSTLAFVRQVLALRPTASRSTSRRQSRCTPLLV